MKESGRHPDMATRKFCQIKKRVPPTVAHRIKKPYSTIKNLNIARLKTNEKRKKKPYEKKLSKYIKLN